MASIPSSTWDVVIAMLQERNRQRAMYGENDDLANGTGPLRYWLGRARVANHYTAVELEEAFRLDYASWETATGSPTWMHLLREEIAEAFQESDPVRLREELLQVAAVATSWVETLDKRAAGAV